jgi:glycerophosphoryl diester phosphodiesterase
MPGDLIQKKLRIITHRCMGFGALENSAVALRAALSSSVDEIELDFRTTRDGELVASHFDLFFDMQGVPRIVSRSTLIENQRHGLMSLKDCLELFREHGQDKRLRIEVKSRGVEQRLVDALTHYRLAERVVVVSWSVGALRVFRELSPTLELSLSYMMGLQGGGVLPFAWPTSMPAALHDASLGIRSVNIIRGIIGPTPEYVSRLLGCGVEVFVLSRGGHQEFEKLYRLGVTGALLSSVREVGGRSEPTIAAPSRG